MTLVLGGLGSFVFFLKEKKNLETKDPGTEVFHQENNVNFAVAEDVKEAKAAPCPAVIGDRHTKARAALEANSRTPTGWGGGEQASSDLVGQKPGHLHLSCNLTIYDLTTPSN